MTPDKPLDEMDERELREWMALDYQPAVTEWLRRHPEAEASDGGRLG